ncbi:hypothetical protein ES703_40002 [subsurface metagenome]
MKKQKEPKFRWGLCAIVCLSALLFEGCPDPQADERMDVDGWRVHLFKRLDQTDEHLPDAWKVSDDTEGRDICSVAHGFWIELLDKDKERLEQKDIRIDIEVDEHWSQLYDRDIWDQTAPGGKKYGFLNEFLKPGSEVYDGVLHGRTNLAGTFIAYAGLGDPKASSDPTAPLDFDYEWPGPGGSYSDCVDTVVQLKMTIPGRLTPLPPIYVWSNYTRVPYQNFKWPKGEGVYHSSMQGIGKLRSASDMIPSPDPNTIEQSAGVIADSLGLPAGMFDLSLFESPGPKLTPSKYPRVTPATKRSLIDILTAMVARAITYVTTSGVTLNSLDLTQLRWDPDIGWAYFPLEPGRGLPGYWIAEPNDPNDIIEMLSGLYPYAFWAVITLPEPFYGDTATTTVILRATDRENVVQSKIPLTMTLVEKSPDNLTVTFLSDWFVVSVDPDFHGYYQDQWQNTYTVLYMPEQTHPELGPPEIFGDFNADDKVNFYDFALFADHWQDSAHDPNTGYDALYEEPYTWDGKINTTELRAFAEHWLWTP